MYYSCSEIKKNKKILHFCGGKGSKLFHLREGGFPVPDFVIIPSNHIQKEIGICEKEIECCTSKINPDNDQSILQVS